MKIMYIILLLVLLLSIFLAKKGGETLDDSPYALELVSGIPTGYEVPDTSQVWKVIFVSLQYCDEMTAKDLDSLYSEAFMSMDQFIFFAEQEDVIIFNPTFIEVSNNKDRMSFLFSVSKKIDRTKIIQILEKSFFGSPTKKADASRLFPFSLFLRDQQKIHILLHLPE